MDVFAHIQSSPLITAMVGSAPHKRAHTKIVPSAIEAYVAKLSDNEKIEVVLQNLLNMPAIRQTQEEPVRVAESLREFSLSNIPVKSTLMIFLNGIYQNPTKYDLINSSIIRFKFDVGQRLSVAAIYQY